MNSKTVAIAILFIVIGGVLPSSARPVSYNKLFQPRPVEQVAREQRRAQDDAKRRPGVVNGMPHIPLDPGVDPKIFIQPPQRR